MKGKHMVVLAIEVTGPTAEQVVLKAMPNLGQLFNLPGVTAVSLSTIREPQ